LTLREFIAWAPDLVTIDKPVSSHLEASGVIAALDGSPVLFTNVDAGQRVLSGFCAGRDGIERSLGLPGFRLLERLAEAMQAPQPPPLVGDGPCQEVLMQPPDLGRLPILKHLASDGGRYLTAGVAVIRDAEFGRNACYHRAMVTGPRQASVRVVEGRGTHTAWRRGEADVPIAFAIGCPLPVLIAAAMSPAKGVDELAIANAIAHTPLVRCRTVPLEVPAEAEIIIEGRLTHRLAPEGPFIDLTETLDGVRDQPVLEVDCITHRRDPIYHAILPGLSEHKTLMGLPREPAILAGARAVCDVRNVKLTRGGMTWLHALVQIHKRAPDDGPRAILAAMEAHPSVKMVIVVDVDISLDDSRQVEWAIATRVQAGRDVYVYRDQPSSSLDPSAKHPKGERARTDKLGVDATIPWPEQPGAALQAHLARFRRLSYPEVDLGSYLRN